MMTRRALSGLTVLTTALVFTACGDGSAPEPESISDDPPAAAGESAPGLRALLGSENRAESDRVRDEGRRPADVIEFLEIDQGMHVIDVIAAGGYYTEVLSLAVGDDGRVIGNREKQCRVNKVRSPIIELLGCTVVLLSGVHNRVSLQNTAPLAH